MCVPGLHRLWTVGCRLVVEFLVGLIGVDLCGGMMVVQTQDRVVDPHATNGRTRNGKAGDYGWRFPPARKW